MFVYVMSPIDFWEGWLTEDEIKDRLHRDDLKRYLARKEKALELAGARGWEGDFRQGPFFSTIPMDDGASGCEVLVGWKQDNNGTTFVVSPYQLPWLREWLVK